MIRGDEQVRSYERALLVREQAPIAAAIARHLGSAPDDLEARMAAAATLTILELLGEDFAPSSGPDAVLDQLDGVLRFVNGGIAAER